MPKKALLGQLAAVDVRLLRIFRTIADVGGLSAAELELNIGRSTISRHLVKREDAPNLLIERTPPNLPERTHKTTIGGRKGWLARIK